MQSPSPPVAECALTRNQVTLSLPHMDAGRLIQSIPLISSPSEKPEKAQIHPINDFCTIVNARWNIYIYFCTFSYLHHCHCHLLVFIIVIVIFLSSSLSLSFSCLHHCHSQKNMFPTLRWVSRSWAQRTRINSDSQIFYMLTVVEDVEK